ncbi:MAG: HipA domain-containing protein [Verrucomicrobiota bacterium]
MTSCPITLEPAPKGKLYSEAGLKMMHPRLAGLHALEYSAEEQIKQARMRADKMSIQGVQPKLSAVLRISKQSIELVDSAGKFILKPNPPTFEEVPANEALTMRMAATAGIDVPAHGLLRAVDDSWVYFVKRYDRVGRSERVHVEDFAQLIGANRDTKYDSSLERVAELVERFCTFPALEKPKLAKRLLFCFLTGNEDMHLKNFSLWHRGGVVSLAPGYDFLNSTLVLGGAKEESALPISGKKKHLTRKLWLSYFCNERLGLSENQIETILNGLSAALPKWRELLGSSYLSEGAKEGYREILEQRVDRLKLS